MIHNQTFQETLEDGKRIVYCIYYNNQQKSKLKTNQNLVLDGMGMRIFLKVNHEFAGLAKVHLMFLRS